MTKLLNIDANAKTVKGQKKGYMTAILYLAPYKLSGVNLCPMAEQAGCWETCLNTAGRGGISKTTMQSPGGLTVPDNAIQHARLARTMMWIQERDRFLSQLYKEIEKFIAKAERKGLIPVVRLNGTSDIQWEKVLMPGDEMQTIFDLFPEVQFYDYTKIAKRLSRPLPDNYYLCLSYSEASKKYERSVTAAWNKGASVVHVVRNEAAKKIYVDGTLFGPHANIVDGDEHDLRFLDPANSVVVLKAKGQAAKETNGFVLD